MIDITIEDNYEMYDDILSESELNVSNLIREVKKNKIIVPRIQRGIVWNKKKVKDLIISLYKGIPIGDITMWRLHNKNPNIKLYRTIFNTQRQIPDWVNFLIDGLQRCSALCAVFSKDEIAIDEKFQEMDLYYNFIKDIFMFKEEIKNLDNTWINLKDTYNAIGDNSNLKESFTREIIDILTELEREDDKKISNRIERIFGLVNKKLKIETYDGENINLAFDLLIFKNLGVQYSILDLLYSVISNFDPKSRQMIEDFSKITKKRLNNKYFNIHDILHLMIHQINPGYYRMRYVNIRTKPSKINIDDISKAVYKVTNKKFFSKFLQILNEAVINLLPLENTDEEFRNQFIITDFRSKSSIYACYCLYIYCQKDNENQEFYQFLGKYFLYNILLERFNQREVDIMYDLRNFNGEPRNFNLLLKKIKYELSEQFWTETLPENFLEKKSRNSDISFIYQLSLIPQFVFNSTISKVKNVITRDMKKKGPIDKKLPITWLKIFPPSTVRKYCENIHPNSIMNYILVDHSSRSKGKLARNRQAWGWLKEILKSVVGIESSIASGYFESWDFPRNYDEEMKIFQDYSKRKEKARYFNEFFESRAKKMAKRIQEIFF